MSRETSRKNYDMQKKNQAITGLGLRALVAGYLVYLACQIAVPAIKGSSPIPVPAVAAICLAFVAAACFFCLYAWKDYRKKLKDAEYAEEDVQWESQTVRKTEQE